MERSIIKASDIFNTKGHAMKRMLTMMGVLLLGITTGFGQTPVFTEDFESGAPSGSWGVFYADEEELQAVDMASAPAALPDGGSYVGYVQDVNNTYNGISVALAGTTTDADYTVAADAYCYTNHPQGSAYTGLVVYADSSKDIYYKFVADFDSDNRFRLYNNRMVGYVYTFHHAIDASSVDTTEGWHEMMVKVQTLDGSYPQFTCYFDGVKVGGPFIDSSETRATSGQYGLFSFQMDFTDGIAGYYDNIAVYDNADSPVSIKDGPEQTLAPIQFVLAQNYPNPFNPSTSINVAIHEGSRVNLTVYDINGKLIRPLMEGFLVPRNYSFAWDGRDMTGKLVPSGVYLYRLTDGMRSETKRMIMMK